MCHIKKLLSGKKQQTGTLYISTVYHLNTPAVHKHYNTTKYSCTTEHAWVLTKHTITSMYSTLTFLAQCIIMNNLHISWNYGW